MGEDPKMIVKSLHQAIFDEMQETCERLGIIDTEYKIPTGLEYKKAINLVILNKDIDYIDSQYWGMTDIKEIRTNPFLNSNRVATIGYNKECSQLDSDGKPCGAWSLILVSDRLQKMMALSAGTMEESKQIITLEMRYLLSAFKLITNISNGIEEIKHEFKKLETIALFEEEKFAGWWRNHLDAQQSEEGLIELKQRFESMIYFIYGRNPYSIMFSNHDFERLYHLRAKAKWY